MNGEDELALLIEVERERDPVRYSSKLWFHYDFKYQKRCAPQDYVLRQLPSAGERR